jgi:hypothetical protein
MLPTSRFFVMMSWLHIIPKNRLRRHCLQRATRPHLRFDIHTMELGIVPFKLFRLRTKETRLGASTGMSPNTLSWFVMTSRLPHPATRGPVTRLESTTPREASALAVHSRQLRQRAVAAWNRARKQVVCELEVLKRYKLRQAFRHIAEELHAAMYSSYAASACCRITPVRYERYMYAHYDR